MRMAGMSDANNKPEPEKAVHEILRERWESLSRIRASLETVEGLQRQFEADSQNARSSDRYPVKSLEGVIAPNVKLITIDQLKISLVLQDNTVIEIAYPSAQALSEDLGAWCKAATPEDLKRLDITPRLAV